MPEWRDTEGFGRPVEVQPPVMSVTGPDNEGHAEGCDFYTRRGILPCSCDFTRLKGSWWYTCWLRWLEARVSQHAREVPLAPVPWPIKGPDEGAWIQGIDFD